jgi:sarcosine oxidase
MATQQDIGHVDIAVVGLGLIGSGALAALATDGSSCVGIGPGEPRDWARHDGPFASHYDSGRITRHLDPAYEWALLAQRAIAGYAEREAASGVAFHRPVGVVLAETDPARIAAIRDVAERLGVEIDGTADPRLRFAADATLLAESAPAGHVDPRRMVVANLLTAASRGARVVSEAAVVLDTDGDRWRVTTTSGRTIVARRVVVATGAHSDEVAGLTDCPPLMVRGETVVLATLDGDEATRLAGMPSVLARLADATYTDLYVVPPTDYPDGSVRLKLGATLRDHRRLHDADQRRAWMQGDDHGDELRALRRLLEDLVPGLQAVAWETKPCLITDTASGLPVVDHLAPHLVLAAGGNGFAAKSANAIGALAARLVVDGRWTDDELDHRLFAATRIGER